MSEMAIDKAAPAQGEPAQGEPTPAAAPLLRPHIPLAVARRRYGQRLLMFSMLGMLALALLLLAQAPPALRADTAALIPVLGLVYLGTGLLALLWTWVAVWPRERKRLAGATPIGRLSELPPTIERATLTLALGGGMLIGALLWTVLNTAGFVAAPLLWLTLASINLETARRVHRVEQRHAAMYFVIPAPALFRAAPHLYVLSMP